MEKFTFPAEDEKHEGTWLTWPHAKTYGKAYQKAIEPIWVQMAESLHTGEKVHIMVYDEQEEARVHALLEKKGLDMSQVDFLVVPSDDVWSRDSGPMFVRDEAGELRIVDFGFNGWGGKMESANDDVIPQRVAEAKGYSRLDVADFVLEGGSVELDGHGTALLTRSAVLNENRNPGMSQEEAEAYMTQYLGAANFIWLDGVSGEDITDAHIDAIARFVDDKRMVAVSKADFFDLYEGIKRKDLEILYAAQNAKGEAYAITELPLTKKNVKGLDYKGSYVNFYVGNEVVLVPIYSDANDQEAMDKIQKLYPDREVVGIDVSKLYKNGGMIHCVTQQQPQP
ncbi:agmatine deiminase family protein [Streptococcus sp. NLN64]|uniref:agmatine deiminase family protein n=1 Tax=Streptococcus sp. NLN64 TaxID=2822799 RepID=UPI0018C933D8|nr:agmatine deiminase family protein [Streptococcus sp. NLN64]MBG9368107.1 agmatine deiminase family protein [Streptococcus sp. NLN64]